MPDELTPEERNLEEMRRFQALGTSANRRRSAPYLQNIDNVLKEYEDSDSARELAKAKNTAEIEKIFPGVEEDEKTLSGMYEPDVRHYALGKEVYRDRRPDVEEIISYQHIAGQRPAQEQLKMFPKSEPDTVRGTGLPNHKIQKIDSDSDSDTPDFGTERDERDYAGFEAFPLDSEFMPIGSRQYWNHLDNYSRTNILERNRAREQRQQERETEIEQRRERTRRRQNSGSRNPEAGPIRDIRRAAQLMAEGQPARAGGTRETGTHSFRARPEPTYHTGRLPRELSPNLRNLETDFTVYSYNTPIAWRTTSGHWEVPNVSYSRTTHRHQSAIRNALSNTHYSPFSEARERVYNLREQHRQQGINLPSTKYNLNVGFETFSPHPPSEETVNAIVQNHIEKVINPAIERRRNSRNFQRQQRNPNQLELPLNEVN